MGRILFYSKVSPMIDPENPRETRFQKKRRFDHYEREERLSIQSESVVVEFSSEHKSELPSPDFEQRRRQMIAELFCKIDSLKIKSVIR